MAGTVARVATVAVANPESAKPEPLPDPSAESRRQRVLALLASDPGRRYAVVSESAADGMRVAVGIRGRATCELWIPHERYDGLRLLAMVEALATGPGVRP